MGGTGTANDDLVRQVSRILGLALMAGVVATAYGLERWNRHIGEDADPYAGLRTFVRDSRTSLNRRRQGVSEFAQFVGEIMGEIERASGDGA